MQRRYNTKIGRAAAAYNCHGMVQQNVPPDTTQPQLLPQWEDYLEEWFCVIGKNGSDAKIFEQLHPMVSHLVYCRFSLKAVVIKPTRFRIVLENGAQILNIESCFDVSKRRVEIEFQCAQVKFMSAAYFEEALQNFIYNLATVQALFPRIAVRVMKLQQNDPLPAIIIGPDKETHENDLTYHGGGVIWSGKIRCVSKKFADTRLLTEAVRNNGSSPGTGLAGFSGPMDGWEVQGARFGESEFDFIFYEDGTDEGDFIIDTTCVVEFAEPL